MLLEPRTRFSRLRLHVRTGVIRQESYLSASPKTRNTMSDPGEDTYRHYLEEVETLLKATPTYPDLLNRRGLLKLHLGERAGARRDFVAALTRNNRYEKARVNLAFALAEDDFRSSLDLIANIAKSSLDSDERYVDMARLCYLHDHPTEAWDAVYHAIDLNPNNSLPLHWGAYFLHRENRTREAHRWLLRAARIAGGGVESYEKLGVRIDADLSVADLARRIEEVSPLPGFAEIHTETARWLYTSGKRSEAVVELERILIHDPHFAPFATHRGWMEFLSGHHDDAETWLLKALECDPEFARAHEQLAHFYAASGDRIRSEQHLVRAIRLRPGYPDLRYDLALQCTQTDRMEEAVAHLRSCLAIAPNFSMARIRLGECYARLGDVEAAAAQFQLLPRETLEQPEVKELVETCLPSEAFRAVPAKDS
jgi:tetratricopeptide (TPR) repeat protein